MHKSRLRPFFIIFIYLPPVYLRFITIHSNNTTFLIFSQQKKAGIAKDYKSLLKLHINVTIRKNLIILNVGDGLLRDIKIIISAYYICLVDMLPWARYAPAVRESQPGS